MTANAGLILLVASPVILGLYAYIGYPLLLQLFCWMRKSRTTALLSDAELPIVTITLPAYNESARIGGALEALLATDYPAEKRHILVISDASSDDTDDIARRYADRGVELLRMPTRSGKTAAENASRDFVRGEIVINTDASVRVTPGALKALVRVFADPTVGVASGRDLSVGAHASAVVAGEAGYVGYEMYVRRLESEIDGIVGASGCFFAIRRALHSERLPDSLSRDFASALVARVHGFRAVSVEDATCLVPRAGSLAVEYRRKIRTMARGVRTLWYMRRLLAPHHFGFFALALWSHKLARWLVYPAALLSLALIVTLALQSEWARVLLALSAAGLLAGAVSKSLVERGNDQRLIRILAFGYAANAAGVMAWWEVLCGRQLAVWEPTRRPD